MQTDPVGYKDGLNWYDYVHNDPVNGSDPSGNGPPAVRYGLGYASEGVRAGSIDTPYGAPATQGADKASLDAAAKVTTETPLYRIGTANISNAQNAQFWSLHMPDIYTNGHIDEGKVEAYAVKMGIPKGNISNASGDLHLLEVGTLKPGTPFITRAAPGIGANAGGGIEFVTQPGGVQLRMFNVISTPRMNSGGKSGSALSEVMEIEERAAESPR